MNGVSATADMEPIQATEPFNEGVVDLYRAYASDLLEMLWVYVGDKGVAEDLVQESFIRLHRAWPRLDHSGSVTAYLRSIAFNLARSGFRRRMVALRHRPHHAFPADSAEAAVILREDQQEVASALRTLPDRQRQCVVLRYWTELGDQQIAQELGITVNSVKTHLRRGLAALEKRLEARS